jgi:hypothetical protein
MIRLAGSTRLLSAGLSVFGIGVLLVAAMLQPYGDNGGPLRYGTHRQLGLPPCHVQAVFGIPCPSCGMTTSISLCMHGDVAGAWDVNGAGVIVTAFSIASILWLAGIALVGWAPRSLTPDCTVQWLAISGAMCVGVRYAAVAVSWFLG